MSSSLVIRALARRKQFAVNSCTLFSLSFKMRPLWWCLAAAVCFLPVFLSAQGWHQTFSQFPEAQAVAVLSNGDIIVAGRAGVTPSTALDDALVLRTDTDGELIWSGQYGTITDRDLAASLVITPEEEVVVVGSSNSFAPSSEIYLFKVDGQGRELWTRSYGGFFSDRANRIQHDEQGGYLLTGCYDCTSFSSASQTVLIRTDKDGQELWTQTYPQAAEGFDAIPTSDGGYLISAVTSNDSASFLSALVMIKTDANGQTLWSQSFGNDTLYNARSVLEVSDGYLLAGTARIPVTGDEDPYLIKTDLNGNPLWTKFYGSPEGDYVTLAKKASSGGFIMAGNTFGFGHPEGDALLIRVDDNGDLLWQRNYGHSIQLENIKALTEKPDGGFLIGGVTQLLNGPFSAEFSHLKLFNTDADGQLVSHVLEGRVYLDDNNNCTDDDEPGWENVILAITEGTHTQYTSTDSSGYWNIQLAPGLYQVAVMSRSENRQLCNGSIVVDALIPFDTTQLSLGLQEIYSCPDLRVDISTTYLSPCSTSIYHVNYENQGTQSAQNAYLDLLPDPSLTILPGAPPFTQLGDTLRFQLGDLPIGFRGSLELPMELDCTGLITGQTHCLDAHIYPDSNCLPVNSSWSGASLLLEGSCVDDSVVVHVTNKGIGDMIAATQLIIIEDQIIGRTEQTQLNSGGLKELKIDAAGKTIRVEVPQPDGHPGESRPSISIEGCGLNNQGDFSRGFVTRFPEDDRNNFRSIDCQESLDSIGGFLKRAYPKGTDPANGIESDTELEYHFYFRNESQDTLRRLVIRDTLDAGFDPQTVEPGAASHAYRMEVYGTGIVKFIFEDISIYPFATHPDSAEIFVKYRVGQASQNAVGTILSNQSLLYPGTRSVVAIDSVFHTILRSAVYASDTVLLCGNQMYQGQSFLNDTSLIDTTQLLGYDSITFVELIVRDTYFIVIDTLLQQGIPYQDIIYLRDTTLNDVYTSVGGCDSIVQTNIIVETVGQRNLSDIINQIRVHPNPADPFIDLELDIRKASPLNIQLFDALGQEVHLRVNPLWRPGVGQHRIRIPTQHLANGSYWIRLTSEKASLTKPIHVQHKLK